MQTHKNPPAIFLMGPTASGKSELSVRLAQTIDAEIISVDSALVYRGMDVGTAKPSMVEQGGIPHHLIDILDPAETFSTGQFRKRALNLMAEITERGRIPLLTGGTMLYFNGLFQGLAELPSADPVIRAQLNEQARQHGNEYMHRRLAQVDEDSAARIHPNDPQRIQRALEVYEITGKPLTHFFKEAEAQQIPYHKVKLIIAPVNRKILHQKIATRFLKMLEQDLIEEVRRLHQRKDLSEKMPSIRAVGYRQVWSYLENEYDYETMKEKAIIATRQLAKRQFTWLRRVEDAQLFDTEEVYLLQNVLRKVKKEVFG